MAASADLPTESSSDALQFEAIQVTAQHECNDCLNWQSKGDSTWVSTTVEGVELWFCPTCWRQRSAAPGGRGKLDQQTVDNRVTGGAGGEAVDPSVLAAWEYFKSQIGNLQNEFGDLVRALVGGEIAAFNRAITRTRAISKEGLHLGLRALETAICLRTNRPRIDFYTPAIVVPTNEECDRAFQEMMSLARQGQLLDDPARSQSLMTPAELGMANSGRGATAQELADQVQQAGGLRAVQEFLLLATHSQ